MKKTWLVILIIVIIVGGYLGLTYNKFVGANETADNQWAQVEAQYQRRFDLIPNLVASVQGVMKQEQAVFGQIAEARTRYSGATTINEKAAAATEVESALSRLLVIMENYPQLKSSEAVQTLMAQLEGTENRISVERNRYNDTIKSYNLMTKRIPSKWVASWFGFADRTYFEAQAGSEVAPQVNL